MKRSALLLISVFMLSISIIIGSTLIGNSLQDATRDEGLSQVAPQTVDKVLLTEVEAADYLGFSHDMFISLVSDLESQRRSLSVYDTYRFIPFLKINGAKYFSKEGLEKWVEYNIENREVIEY